jgi:hypothetical protein
MGKDEDKEKFRMGGKGKMIFKSILSLFKMKETNILSRIIVAVDGVRIGNWIY